MSGRRVAIAGRITMTTTVPGVYLVEGTRRSGARIAWYFGDESTARRVAERLRRERSTRAQAVAR